MIKHESADPRGVFITGTDTGVGKTLVAAGLLRILARQGRRAVGLKPVASGAVVTAQGLRNADAEALAAESTVPLPYDRTNPHCFEPAIAPHLAAADAGVCVSVGDLVAWYARATAGVEVAVVEGAGGWRVPLHPDGFLSDLPEFLEMDVILVVGLRLGCLNHARLTAEAIERGGRCRLAGWVGNHVDCGFARVADNVASLERLLGSPPLAVIPRLDTPSAEAASRHLANERTRTALGLGP
jgi:dethiobiotin synthetase